MTSLTSVVLTTVMSQNMVELIEIANLTCGSVAEATSHCSLILVLYKLVQCTLSTCTDIVPGAN